MRQLRGFRTWLLGLLVTLLLLFTLHLKYEASAEVPAAMKRRREGSYHVVLHRDGNSKERVFLVAAVTSPAAWQQRRSLLRNQWVKNVAFTNQQVTQKHVHTSKVVLKFAVGTEGLAIEDLERIIQEDIVHKDILLLHGVSDLEVDYSHLNPNWPWYNTSATSEKVLYSIQWAVNNYEFQYFARIGDDAYFRVDEFHRQARAEAFPTSMAVFGQMIGPLTYPVAGKENSIVYPSGAGYIMTQDVASFISASAGMLNVGYPEDANFGAWLAGTKVVFYDMGDRIHDLQAEMPFYRPCTPRDILVHRLHFEADWNRINAEGFIQC